MLVTVAICTWNRAALLDQTLARMRALSIPTGTEWELLVVNNNCTDHTDSVIAKHTGALPIRRIAEPTPGLSFARNAALAAAKGEHLLWTDDDVLAVLLAGARSPFDELVAAGWAEVPRELPAPWVEHHIKRMGGWRLAPKLLADQLAAIEPPAPLVMVPRRQRKKLNGQLDFLGERAEILIHPDDGAAAGVVNGRPVTVRSANGELTGVAKIDDSIRRGAVSIPHGHHEANVNRLTNKDDIDRVTGMVRYSGIPVSLHPA